MMVIKCDICGKEVEEQGGVYIKDPSGIFSHQYDLCDECAGKMYGALNGIAEEHGINLAELEDEEEEDEEDD